MTDFERTLYGAQNGDADAMMTLLTMFQPLLLQYSMINKRFNEDLMQSLTLKFMVAVRRFKNGKRGLRNK